MQRYVIGTRCTIEVFAGQFCDLQRAPDMPFPICADHALRLFRRMQSMIQEAKDSGLAIPGLIDNLLEQDRARANTPQHRVYYLRVGELIKIGTTKRNLKDRIAAYPPNSALLAVERGGEELEARRHRQFHHLLAERKEWFRPGAELMEHIAGLGR